MRFTHVRLPCWFQIRSTTYVCIWTTAELKCLFSLWQTRFCVCHGIFFCSWNFCTNLETKLFFVRSWEFLKFWRRSGAVYQNVSCHGICNFDLHNHSELRNEPCTNRNHPQNVSWIIDLSVGLSENRTIETIVALAEMRKCPCYFQQRDYKSS